MFGRGKPVVDSEFLMRLSASARWSGIAPGTITAISFSNEWSDMTQLSDIFQGSEQTQQSDSTQPAKNEASHGAAGGSLNIGNTERQITMIAGAALGLLAARKPLSLQALVMAAAGGALLHRGLSGYCALYNLLGIDTRRSTDHPSAPAKDYLTKSIHVEESITIMKSPQELYNFWRNFENLPKFMRHLKDVRKIDDKRSHWVASGPMNYSVEWDAEIINDEPNSLIAWRTVGDAEVDNAGSVRFVGMPQEQGTELRVTIDYIPPAGKVGFVVARLFGKDPQQEIRKDLRRCKQLLEAGEIATNAQGEPRANCC